MSAQGKKIACFVALPHHTRFIAPVAEEARERGAQILYFTTLSDFPFERDLMRKGEEVKLIQGYREAETNKKVDRTTHEFYREWVQRCFKWDGYRHWPLVLQSALVSSGFQEYFCLEQFFKQEQPDMVIALHERNRWGKLLGHFTNKYAIPYVTLQEGDYYEDRISFSGHTEYTTALMLWGRQTSDRLIRFKSAGEKMMLTGNTHLATVRETYFGEKQMQETRKELGIPADKKVVVIMMGLQWGVVKDQSVWEEFLGDLPQRDDLVVVIKWHPKVGYKSYKQNAEDLFKKIFPKAIVVQNFDAYRLLPIADYCVTLGKTTLAVEALSFDRPLFSMPGRDGEPDHYGQWGISQPFKEIGNWKPLYDTVENGVPAAVQERVGAFLTDYFHHSNVGAIENAGGVIDHIFAVRDSAHEPVDFGAGKELVSFVIPSGNDPEALRATLLSLADRVQLSEWEAVVVAHDPAVDELLSQVSGDLVVVQAEPSTGLAELHNLGAKAARGDRLVFLKPGVLLFELGDLLEHAQQGIAGAAIDHPDLSPYYHGFSFDFNAVPRPIADSLGEPWAEGSLP